MGTSIPDYSGCNPRMWLGNDCTLSEALEDMDTTRWLPLKGHIFKMGGWMQRRLIGLDLDNTIIDYERAFAPVAEEIGLIPKGTNLASKEEIKATLRGAAGEEAWMRLQGQIYGR